MTVKGKVLSVSEGSCTVEVRRRAMCDGCHAGGDSCSNSCAMSLLLGERKAMTVTVKNPLGARAGDEVELESSDRSVLASAFLVFILPLILAFAAYFVAVTLELGDILTFALSAAGFVLAFLICLIFERRAKKNENRITLKSVLSPRSSEAEDPLE